MMPPEKWRRIKDLLGAALTRRPEERAAFLDEIGNDDPTIRVEVESLLQAHHESGSFIEEPAYLLEGLGTAAKPARAAEPTPESLEESQVGPYRIAALIGTGGMAEVYRATDTRLGRDVAIKILLPKLSDDPAFSSRLRNEGRLVSTLTHPRICALYDIGEVYGRPYLVGELVVGPSLAERIAGGPLEIAEVLKYAIQIAEALEAAHARGIVHRDIKPANIKIGQNGNIKVLDFGIAKLVGSALGEAKARTLGSSTALRTIQGAIVGTAAYMSPEQAEGKPVDGRSDIFSFGSVLYEMITGVRAFGGQSTISTLSAILTREPPPVSDIGREIPPGLERIVERCLRKDRARRMQHAGDLRIALEEVRDDLLPKRAIEWAQPRPRRRVSGRWLAVAAVVFAAGMGGAWRLAAPAEIPAPILRRLTYDAGLTTTPAVSRDGKLLAYASDRDGDNLDIYVQQFHGGEPMRLTRGPVDEYEPDFSPEGTQVVYRSDKDGGGIYIVSTFGGEPRLVAKEGRSPRFSPDGSRIVFWTGVKGEDDPHAAGSAGCWIVPATGGPPLQIAPGFATARSPVWSVDGEKILFLGNRDPAEQQDWWIATVDSTDLPVKTDAVASLEKAGVHPYGSPPFVPQRWTADGGVLFSAQSGNSANIWQLALSRRGKPGRARRLTFGAGIEEEPAAAGPGRLVFQTADIRTDLWSLPLSKNGLAAGHPRRIALSSAVTAYPSITRDGSRLVFSYNQAGRQRVSIMDLATGVQTRLADSPGDESLPVITPDGRKLAYVVAGYNLWEVWLLPLAGGVPREICNNCGRVWSWSSDGTKFLHGGAPLWKLGLFDVNTRERKTLLAPGFNIFQAQFSPDDRWIALHARTGPGHSRVYLVPYRDGAVPQDPKDWIAITDGSTWDDKPRWSPDGGTLYFFSERDSFRCLWAQRVDVQTKRPVGAPFAVYHFHSSRLSPSNVNLTELELAVARDRIVFDVGEVTGNLWSAEPPQ